MVSFSSAQSAAHVMIDHSARLRAVRTVARLPNVFCKLSMLTHVVHAPQRWWARDGGTGAAQRQRVQQLVAQTVDAFGPQRCMLASNAPVDLATMAPDELIGCLVAVAAPYDRAGRGALFADTCKRAYKVSQ